MCALLSNLVLVMFASNFISRSQLPGVCHFVHICSVLLLMQIKVYRWCSDVTKFDYQWQSCFGASLYLL